MVRHLRTSPVRLHGDFEMEDPATPEEVVRLFIIDRDGVRHAVAGKVGDNLLYVCHRWRHECSESIALEGACEASLACSTCHVIVRAIVSSNTASTDRALSRPSCSP